MHARDLREASRASARAAGARPRPAAWLGRLAGVGRRPVAVVRVTAIALDNAAVPGVPTPARDDPPDRP